MDNKTRAIELVEKAAMEFVMADSADQAVLSSISASITESGRVFGNDKAVAVSLKIAGLCDKISSSPENEKEELFKSLGASITAYQQLISGAANEEIIYPEELGISGGVEKIGEYLNKIQTLLSNMAIESEKIGRKELANAAINSSEIIGYIMSGRQPGPDAVSKAAESFSVLFTADASGKTQSEKPSVPGPANDNSAVTADLSLVNDFIHESLEHLDAVDSKLLVLETDARNSDALNSVFRAFHTMKSLSGFLEINQVHSIVKEVENLLGQARKGELKLHGEAIETVFRATDMTRHMIDRLKNNPMDRQLIAEAHENDLIDDIRAVVSGKTTVKVRDTAVEAVAAGINPESFSAVKEMVKIDSSKLQSLIDIIGEVVIAESMVVNDSALNANSSGRLASNVNHLNKTTKMLHELGLSLRLIPVNSTFQKMARLVRDVAKKHNKPVNFSFTGEETEIDRGVVEKIQDPLVHMLRNAVDHGIEDSPSERVAAGKSETASITLKAYHKGGNIIIEVSDDGKGLDRDRIIARAVENGIFDKDSIPENDNDIYKLIFRPGFSTARVITDTSGRGVGMDVVKKNVDQLRGTLTIDTKKGAGTKFTVSLPLTTAIIEAITIRLNNDRFFVPTLSIVESVRPVYGAFSTVAGKGVMLAFRDKLIPIFSLNNLFFSAHDTLEGEMIGKIVVIVEDNGSQVGLVVDEILEPQEIVVKNLGNGLEKVPGIAACTIMSDGRVGLILDIAELIRMSAV